MRRIKCSNIILCTRSSIEQAWYELEILWSWLWIHALSTGEKQLESTWWWVPLHLVHHEEHQPKSWPWLHFRHFQQACVLQRSLFLSAMGDSFRRGQDAMLCTDWPQIWHTLSLGAWRAAAVEFGLFFHLSADVWSIMCWEFYFVETLRPFLSQDFRFKKVNQFCYVPLLMAACSCPLQVDHMWEVGQENRSHSNAIFLSGYSEGLQAPNMWWQLIM